MVRATTLPVTSESTHRLPSCNICLLTISIHSNNAFGLNISRCIPPLHTHPHPSSTPRILSRHVTAQRNTTRHDTTQHDVTAASLPYLPYLRYLTTLLTTPSPSPSSLSQNPASLTSLIPISNPIPPISHPSQTATHPRRQHASAQATGPAARYVRQRQGRGVALRSQTPRSSEAAPRIKGFVARATSIVMLTQTPNTTMAIKTDKFRRLRHNYNYL
jgi:hypothetical protein